MYHKEKEPFSLLACLVQRFEADWLLPPTTILLWYISVVQKLLQQGYVPAKQQMILENTVLSDIPINDTDTSISHRDK